MKTMHVALLFSLFGNYYCPNFAQAKSLENGDMIVVPDSPTPCGGIFSGLQEVCKLVDKAGFGCKPVVDICNTGTQELFSGTLIEFASPQNMKPWNGLGGLGAFYSSAAVCMMRDISDMPFKKIATHAELNVIDAAAKQTVAMSGFDPSTGFFEGYHRLKACGPVVGCLDVFTQKFHLHPVSSNLIGSGHKAGQYEIKTSYALELQADGIAQGLVTAFPKITVPTPIGPVTVQPEFWMGRATGLIGAPFNYNKQTNYPSMFMPVKENKTFDIYGRITGATQSTMSPIDTALNDPDWKFSQKGWISTLALGGRDSGPDNAIWKPNTSEAFPMRPDLDPTKPRSKEEKTSNAYMRAAANVEYSIVDKLPSALAGRLKCKGFVELCLDKANVFAKPAFDMVYSSQLSFFQNEQSYWNQKTTGGEFPLPLTTPDSFDQHKELKIMANSTVTAMTSIETGLNLLIRLKVNGPFGFTKLLVDLKPRIVLPLAHETDTSKDTKTASARSLGSAVVGQKKIFQDYTSWNGVNRAATNGDGGSQAIVACSKTSKVEYSEPPIPEYSPGNPNDLLDLFEHPCNICVAWDDIKYKDEQNKEQIEPKGNYTVFPADKSSFSNTDQWACLQAAQLGCYDTCKVTANGKLVVKHTAVQLIASGQGTNMPKSCKIYNPTIGN